MILLNDSKELNSYDIRKGKWATQAIFLICGLGISSWAVMVPLAKSRLNLNDAELGSLLLLLGAGSVTMMPATGVLLGRLGSRIIILFSAIVISFCLPLLLILSSPV